MFDKNLTHQTTGFRQPVAVGLIIACIAFLIAACSPEMSKPSLHFDATGAFSDSGTYRIPDRWWITFGDSGLNAWVDSALHSNFNLKTAWQRIREARAIVDRESASFFPDLTAFFSGETGSGERGNGASGVIELDDAQQFRTGLTSNYEIDLWGRIKAGIDAEKYRENASYADYQTAAISISAELVRIWYQLADAYRQIDLINRQIETNEKVLNLIRIRFGSGQIRSVDILRQQELLESTREQKIAAEGRVHVLRHQLKVLTGRTPGSDLSFRPQTLPELTPVPSAGLPAGLIQRRPDVQSALRLLHAADRDMAAAVSNRYPRLSFSASVSTTGKTAGSLFDQWFASFSGNLFAPVFDAGARSAEVDRTEALKMQRLYQYGQTVLIAFREVEDALILEQKQIERIESIKQQIEYAGKTLEQLRTEYLNGISNYLDILIALNDEQQLRRDLLTARLNRLEFRIALYRALAGGFKTAGEKDDRNE